MSEWKKLSDLVERKICYGIVQPGNKVGNVPIIKVNNIIAGLNTVENLETTTEEIASKYERTKLKGGELIISLVGTVGVTAIVPHSFAGCNLVRATGMIDIVDDVLAKYVKYYLETKSAKEFLYGRLNTTVQPTLNVKTLENLPIPIIDRHKIIAITSILSSLDDKIAVNRRICENLEAQAQALFKHWFIDFAPFKNGQFVESELGMIPERWRVGRAEDFYTINIGKTPPRAERQWFSESRENNIIWISISDMGGCGAFISDSKEYLTPEAQSKFNVVMVPVGTVLLSFKLTLGRVAIADAELTTNEAIARFILPSSDYREYTYLYLKQFKYGSLGSTSSIATAVNSKIIKAMPFLMPSKEVIKDFSNIAGKLFDEIKNLNQESTRLSTLRDTLLPKLMSGELKVNEIETKVI